MAAAFAKQTERLQTLAVTSSIGPGALNMVTGAALATTNRVPVLLFPSDIFANRMPDPVLQQVEDPTNPDVSANDAFRPVSKFWDRVNRPEQLMVSLPRAMRVLTDPADTGAAVVCMPEDVQAEVYDWPVEFFAKKVWHIDRRVPDRAALALERRDGDTPFIRPDTWSGWRPDTPGVPSAARRYVQWRLALLSADGQSSPRVAGFRLAVARDPVPAGWGAGARVTEWQIPDWQAAPADYRYEDYRHPELQRLRREARLDERVSALATDFEIMRALMRWAYRVPLRAFTANDWPFPDISWNALDYAVLERDADGTPRENTYAARRRDGFCMVPNLVLMQALLAYGLPARYTTLDGHEVCEAWSNEHRKWILLDATRDFYYADRETGVPLNALEALRLAWEAPARLALEGAPNPHPLDPAHSETISRDIEGFRILPRNNFLAQRTPLPLNPGYTTPWPWNGYLNWEDPARPVYHAARVSGRARDFYWSVNQVRLALECGPEPGAVTVWLDTDTPGLARLLARVDGGDWRPVRDGWTWALHPGENRLRVRSENALGRRGPETTATLLWPVDGGAPGP